jgi:hypothetical protein
MRSPAPGRGHRTLSSRNRSSAQPAASAAAVQSASTPSPAHGPIGAVPVPGVLAWTASPAVIGEIFCTTCRARVDMGTKSVSR